MQTYLDDVKELQGEAFARTTAWLGRSGVFLLAVTSPSWVALFMIHKLTNYGDPIEILLGALVTAAVGSGLSRGNRGVLIGATTTGTVFYHLILYARPFAQAGAVVLASWVLLIGGVRAIWELIEGSFRLLQNVTMDELQPQFRFLLTQRIRLLLVVALVF